MNRRRFGLLLAALGFMAAIAALAQQKGEQPKGLLLLDWASQAKEAAPPVAILIEMGIKDAQPKNWSGKAAIEGAKLAGREGYRFRDGDKLTGGGWEASSHKPMRGPGQMPKAVQILMEPTATVGVVYHLTDIQPDASITLSVKEQELNNVKVPLKEVFAGKTQALANGRLAVRLISTAVPVYTGPTEDDFPAACYGPDGTLWLAWIAYHVKDDSRRIEAPNLKEQPTNFRDYYAPEYGDQLFVKYFRNGKWSDPFAVTDAKQDLMRCAIAVDPSGVAWVAYSAQRKDGYDVYACSLNPNVPDMVSHPRPKLGPEQPVASKAGGRLIPVMCTDQGGEIWLACQSWSQDGARTQLFRRAGGKWVQEKLAADGGTAWHAALTAGLDDTVALGTDSYTTGDYDVRLSLFRHEKLETSAAVADSSRYEARPSLCYDPKGRLWIAYEEGPEQWGKNYGPLDERGNPLYFARTVKVVCLENGKLMKPVAELPPLGAKVEAPDSGQKVEALPRLAYPKIGIDGKGRLWLTYRVKFGTRYTTHPGAYWLTFARRLDGDKWTDPVELHHSDGLLDDRPVLLPHPAGGLRVIHSTDHRYTNPETINNDLYLSYVDLPGAPVEPKLAPHDPGKKDPRLVAEAKAEQEAIRRCREYRIAADGRKYQLLRGEFHRHTEISWDGGPDGSLEDMR